MSNINTSEVGFYPALIQDYLSGELKNKQIIDWDYSKSEILNLANKRSFYNREVLVKVLKKQHNTITTSELTSLNIKKLLLDNCFTVCTGHQLSLFGGPAYFFSKILETIRLATDLNHLEPNKHFVPVFWMASEDHDFEEVATVTLFNQYFKWETQLKGAVGNFKLDELQPVLEDFLQTIGSSSGKAKTIGTVFKNAFKGEYSLTQATRIFVNELLGEHGLIIIDGNDAELKQLLRPVIEKELFEQIVEKSVLSQIEKLKPYKIQAHPRNINLFYLRENYRERIEKNENNFNTVDNTNNWNSEQITLLIKEKPEVFSPNVFLRPIYQELCLPNVAYIGGAGEIAYWLELPLLFKNLQINFPLPVVRNSILYLSEKQQQQIEQLGLKTSDFFMREDLLINHFINLKNKDNISLSEEQKTLHQLFDSLLEKALHIDKNLEKVVLGEQKRWNEMLDNIEKRFKGTQKNRYEQEINQIRNLKAKIFPNNIYQERINSFLEFELKSSSSLISKILAHLEPLENSIKTVVY